MDCQNNDNLIKNPLNHPMRVKFFGNFTLVSTSLVLLVAFFLGLFIADTQGKLGIFESVRNLVFVDQFISYFNNLAILPILIILIPIIGGIIQLTFGLRSVHKRDLIVIFMTFLTILLVMFAYPKALNGGLHYEIPGILGLGLTFHADMLGFTMLMITSLIWFFVMVYAHEYMKKERHCNRFFVFMALTYGAVLGTILAGDLLTLFLFLEIMTFTSYILVIHGQQEESFTAGYNYILMGILGGFAILTAILLVYFTVGDLRFSSAIVALRDKGPVQYWIIGLLIFGFGIKAGMAPVHVWLPRAHPVAPTPASALLSGIMIKVGAYGILRVATSYFFPTKIDAINGVDSIWLTTQTIGSAVIWIGIITMAIGVFMALQQSNIKKMLAYHSISQMGYILMGIGVALYLGYKGAMGYTGALYHIINHALFKSLLFMVAGVVYFHTRESDMYKLGGLWRKLPLTAIVCLIASFGIVGMPFFNGFISKSILHHGIVEAYTYGHPSFFYAEMIFIIISAGTFCSFIKLFYYVFLGKMPDKYKTIAPEYNSLDTALLAVAVLIIAIGLNPRFILDTLIVPQLYNTTFDPIFIHKYVEGLHFFTSSDLTTTLLVFGLGGLIFYVGTKFHLFHLKLPRWMRFEYVLFYPINYIMRNACILMYGKQCLLEPQTVEYLKLHDHTLGFVDRFVVFSKTLNKKYESTIIKSDSLIYTGFITAILLFMALMLLLR